MLRHCPRIAPTCGLLSLAAQFHIEQPVIPVIEQERHRVADARKRRGDLRSLDAARSFGCLPNIDKQLIPRQRAHQRRPCLAAVEPECMIEVEVE